MPTGIAIDWNSEKIRQLEALMKLNPTSADAASILGVHRDTMEKFIRREYKLTFAEFREIHMAGVRAKLIRTALKQAESGENNTMLIFCLKNLCGWTDKKEISGNELAPIVLKYNIDDL